MLRRAMSTAAKVRDNGLPAVNLQISNAFDAVYKRYIIADDKQALIHIRINENADAITALTQDIKYIKAVLNCIHNRISEPET